MSQPIYRHVFLNGQLHGTYTKDEWENAYRHVPNGAFVRASDRPSNHWYLRQWSSFVPLNDCDIPKELKALCLILNIISS